MQIHFKSEDEADCFYFCDLNDTSKVKLPVNVSTRDFLFLVQASLDQIRPVILIKNNEYFNELIVSELKSNHFKFEKNKWIFLNYSIRNSLSRFDSSLLKLNSFDDIYLYFEKNFKK